MNSLRMSSIKGILCLSLIELSQMTMNRSGKISYRDMMGTDCAHVGNLKKNLTQQSVLCTLPRKFRSGVFLPK